MCVVKTLNDVFNCWDTIPEMAGDVDESSWNVQKWKTRKRIPDRYWTAVIEAVRRKGKRLTANDLLAMHASSARANRVVACK